jgi:hypothetical protein
VLAAFPARQAQGPRFEGNDVVSVLPQRPFVVRQVCEPVERVTGIMCPQAPVDVTIAFSQLDQDRPIGDE